MNAQWVHWMHLCGVLLCGALIPTGCAPVRVASDPSPSTTRPLEGTLSRVRFRVQPVCSAEFDGFALPLVSPDGRWAALQRTSTADWPTLLAALDGGQPNAGTLTIVALTGPNLGKAIEVPGTDLLLGRAADDTGFLVESPRVDGSRWIGKVAWTGGAPVWLRDGTQVCAFATINGHHSMAWCERERANERFGLRVRQGDIVQEIPAPDDGSWLAPTFSNDGRYLYALRLRDGVLSACAFPVSSAMSTVPTHSIDLSWRADARSAYQTLVPLRTGGLANDARLWLFHPRFGRVACWNPLTDGVALASPRSAGIAAISTERIVTTSDDGLSTESMPSEGGSNDGRTASEILSSLWIPIWRGDAETLLIAHPHHGRDGQLDIARIELDSGRLDRPIK